MKIHNIKFLFIAFSILVNGLAFSQIKETVYFTNTFQATNSNTDFLKAEVSLKKDKLVIKSYTFDKKWKKIKTKVFESINDSVYINKSIRFDKNTLYKANYVIHTVYLKPIDSELFYFKEYNYNNILLREGSCKSYFPLVKHGKVVEYYLDGTTSNITEYNNNAFITSERWNKNGLKSTDDVFMEVEIGPKHDGESLEAFQIKLLRHIEYPLNPGREKAVRGNCIVEFILDKHGIVQEIQIIEESGFPILDNQICNYIRKHKEGWSPAMISNKKVDHIIRIGVSFSEP